LVQNTPGGPARAEIPINQRMSAGTRMPPVLCASLSLWQWAPRLQNLQKHTNARTNCGKTVPHQPTPNRMASSPGLFSKVSGFKLGHGGGIL